MKKFLLIGASPRKGGNSDIVVDQLASDLRDHEIVIFRMREKNCRPCQACAACQGKDTQQCVLNDDITPLLPIIDQCDGLVIATPIYNQQITSQAKLFIERLYPFFHVGKKNMSNTSKFGKKAAVVCSFWGSPKDVTEKYAAWTAEGLSQMGAEQTRALVFNGIPEAGQILEREDYIGQLHDLAKWLAE